MPVLSMHVLTKDPNGLFVVQLGTLNPIQRKPSPSLACGVYWCVVRLPGDGWSAAVAALAAGLPPQHRP